MNQQQMSKLSEGDLTKIRNLQYAYLQALTLQKQRMYPLDKDITISYKQILTLKDSFEQSSKVRQSQKDITSDVYQKAINNQVYLQKQQLTKTKILLDKMTLLRTQHKKINPKIQQTQEKLVQSYKKMLNWNQQKIKQALNKYRNKWSYTVTTNFAQIQNDISL